MSLPFPQSVLSQHIIALGKTRAGKSSKLRLIVEHLLEHNEPTCIVDPKGDWWGLKSSGDGKHAGYPIVIFGGNHADVPLNPRAGAAVAELIATGNRPSLIDLGGWMISERTQFFIDFASTWFKVARGHRKLVIDEVHNFAPKGKILDPQAGRMLHWANRLASEAAGKGTILIAASQRPQKVHNDFLTSCETLIACKVIHKADRDAIKDWVDGCADPTVGRQMITELASMERPEAWVWSPEAAFGPKRITFPMYATYDSFKPQEPQAAKLKGWAEVDLADVRTRLEAVVAEAAANDPAELKKRIRELEAQVKGIGGLRPEETRAAQDTGYRRGIEDGLADGLRQFSALRETALKALRERSLQISEKALDAAVDALIEGISVSQEPALPEWCTEAQVAVTMHPQSASMKPATRRALEEVAHTAARQVSTRLKPGTNRVENGAGEKLPRGEAAVLAACIQFPEGLRREQLTVLTGYKRSSRDTYIQRLRERGLVEQRGEVVHVTDAGEQALPDFRPLPVGPELQHYWFERLPEGERAILKILVEHYPDQVDRDALSAKTNYKRSSRDTYLQRLAAKQLVTEPTRGQVRASEDLF